MTRKDRAQSYDGKRLELYERKEWKEKGQNREAGKEKNSIVGRKHLLGKPEAYTMSKRRDHLRKGGKQSVRNGELSGALRELKV